MRRPRFIVSLAVCALCWLTAGPGGLALQMSLACRMEGMHHVQHHHHQGPARSEGPCICDHMTSGFDAALSIGVPSVLDQTTVAWLPPTRSTTAEPFVSLVSFTRSPDTPPPIAA